MAITLITIFVGCEWAYSPCGYNQETITYYDNYGNRTGYGCVDSRYYLDNSDLFFVDEGGNISQYENNN